MASKPERDKVLNKLAGKLVDGSLTASEQHEYLQVQADVRRDLTGAFSQRLAQIKKERKLSF